MQEYNFIGRERELKRLDKMYSSRGQEVALIYGRRRVGKSELIKYFIQQHDEDAIYYECKQTTELNNVDFGKNEFTTSGIYQCGTGTGFPVQASLYEKDYIGVG